MQLRPNDRRWLDLIATHPSATIFHHPAWIGVLEQCYGFAATVVGLAGADGLLAGGIPVMEVHRALRGPRLIALPFSDHCAPVLADDALMPELLAALAAYRRERQANRLEVRWPFEEQAGVYRGESLYLHQTRLSADPGDLFERFHRTRVQQPIRAARRHGVVVRRAESIEDLRTFYRMHLRTRARLGTPVQPFRFFRLLWEHLIATGMGHILIAERDERAMAAALFLGWNGVLTYKFSASHRADWPYAPNHALLWEAIRWGCEHGFRLFDWGRTELHHEGLRQFKRGWDAGEVLSASTILADAPVSVDAGRSVMARTMMAGFIKHSPEWVCRTIGELFYEHFA